MEGEESTTPVSSPPPASLPSLSLMEVDDVQCHVDDDDDDDSHAQHAQHAQSQTRQALSQRQAQLSGATVNVVQTDRPTARSSTSIESATTPTSVEMTTMTTESAEPSVVPPPSVQHEGVATRSSGDGSSAKSSAGTTTTAGTTTPPLAPTLTTTTTEAPTPPLPPPSVKKAPRIRKRKPPPVERDQAPPTPESTASSSESNFSAIPSFIATLDPLSSEDDSSASEDEWGRPKPARPPSYDSMGRVRPRPSYYYDADFDPAHGGGKKKGRRGGLKGVPVFEPTMEDFEGHGGFYGYVKRIEKYGMRSGIAKVIPPKEWSDALPSTTDKLRDIRLREPIEQIMMGQQGVYRVTNVAKTRIWNPAQWKQMAEQPKWAPPDFKKEAAKGDRTDRKPVLNGNGGGATPKRKRRGGTATAEEGDADTEAGTPEARAKKGKGKTAETTPASAPKAPETPRQTRSGTRFGSDVKPEDARARSLTATPSGSPSTATRRASTANTGDADASTSTSAEKGKVDGASDSTISTPVTTKPARAKRASNLQRAEPTDEEWNAFVDKYAELPHAMKKEDYTVELMRDIERRYWRTLTFGEPPMYGADMNGSIFSDETQVWNVAHLGDLLPKLAPKTCQIPGVVSPYLYFGMWRATFAWHVEDADLYSINYIHFGAPKFWYSVPQEQADRFERVMEGYFQQDRTKCSQFLRHKSFLASPRVLAGSNVTLNRCMQLPGEFILTYPKGYHSGFNLGFNCAESINFATERWLPLGKIAKSCYCIGDSVNIDVDVWLTDAARIEAEARGEVWPPPRKAPPTPPPEDEYLKASLAPQGAVFEAPRLEAAPSSSGRKRMFTAKAAELEMGHAAAPGLPLAPAQPPRKKSRTSSSTSNVPTMSSTSSGAQFDHSKSASATSTYEITSMPYPCALCPERSTEGLVKIAEPARYNMSAHRVCVMFTPATWIEKDEETDEETVRGFLDIEKARWKLKCQLCEEKHGTKVQCTKGKCPKAMHVTCGLRLDSGVFLDAKVGDVSLLDQDRAEGGSPKLKSQVPIPQRTTPAMATVPLPSASDAPDGVVNATASASALTPASATSTNEDSGSNIELTILCRQHNPAWQKLEAERKYEELKARVAALPERARLLVRTNNGIFDVTYLANLPHKSAISIVFDDGKQHEVRWRAILWPESPEGLKRRAEIAAKLAEEKAAYERPPTKKRTSFPECGPEGAAGPAPHPYAGHSPYPHTSSAAAYQYQAPPGYFYTPPAHLIGAPHRSPPSAVATGAHPLPPSVYGSPPAYPGPPQYFGAPGAPYPYPSAHAHPGAPVAAGPGAWSAYPSQPIAPHPYGHPYQPYPPGPLPTSGWGPSPSQPRPYPALPHASPSTDSGAPLPHSKSGPNNSARPESSPAQATFASTPTAQPVSSVMPTAPATSSRHSLANLLSPNVRGDAELTGRF